MIESDGWGGKEGSVVQQFKKMFATIFLVVFQMCERDDNREGEMFLFLKGKRV